MNVQNRAESPIMADAISRHALSCILAKFREKFIKMLRARNAMRSVSGRVDPIDAHTSRDAFAHVGVAPSNSQRFPVGSADLVESETSNVPLLSEVSSVSQQPLVAPPAVVAPMHADSAAAQPVAQPPVSTLAFSPPPK